VSLDVTKQLLSLVELRALEAKLEGEQRFNLAPTEMLSAEPKITTNDYKGLGNLGNALSAVPTQQAASSFSQSTTSAGKGRQSKTSTRWAQLQSVSICSKQRQSQGTTPSGHWSPAGSGREFIGAALPDR
jgi:hypothetical protein